VIAATILFPFGQIPKGWRKIESPSGMPSTADIFQSSVASLGIQFYSSVICSKYVAGPELGFTINLSASG
jgi:hypothetical protein